MADFENPHLKGKTLEELIDDLGKPVAEPGSIVHEMLKAAITARMAERLATPRRWAIVALIAAMVSAGAAAASAIVAFSGSDSEPAASTLPVAQPNATPTRTPFFEPTPKPGEGLFDEP